MENYFDKIATYISNQMAEKEKAAFEKEMAKDKALAEEVNAQKEVAVYAELVRQRRRIAELKGMVDEGVENPVVQDSVGKRASLFRYLAIAASILFLLVAAYYLVNTNDVVYEDFKPEVAAVFQPYKISMQRSSENQTKDLQDKANQFYQQKKYGKAIPLLKELRAADAENYLMLGNAYFATGKFGEALVQFNLLIENKDIDPKGLYTDDTKWYAALSYLQLGNKPECTRLLKTLLTETTYSSKAKSLVEKLE